MFVNDLGGSLMVLDTEMVFAAFAWLGCKEENDLESLLKEKKVLTRGGDRCGSDKKYVRVNMIGPDKDFEEFLHRLLTIRNPNCFEP